ncbi:hypothetical protein [Dethiobacter alkaliphilus]|uniref:Lipoprotein n=1 Tax=Dethiobacter alkaliphilus AHT 1 TaxID=555088 RepID=C0GFM7_DETAL|nr:hypothetical protein [Dethiobacter alkaliphilus]EEG77987.1 hypothetical protein DealDRAFT_1286 [Dethiobacter alkaliphilus AHT 1]
MTKILAVVTFVLLIITFGCGMMIRYGGEAFKDAVGGHMVLGIITLISMAGLLVTVFRQ